MGTHIPISASAITLNQYGKQDNEHTTSSNKLLLQQIHQCQNVCVADIIGKLGMMTGLLRSVYS